MKAVKIVAVLCLVSGCAGNGPYGADNPNATKNAVATGAGAAAIYGIIGLAVFTAAMKDLN